MHPKCNCYEIAPSPKPHPQAPVFIVSCVARGMREAAGKREPETFLVL